MVVHAQPKETWKNLAPPEGGAPANTPCTDTTTPTSRSTAGNRDSRHREEGDNSAAQYKPSVKADLHNSAAKCKPSVQADLHENEREHRDQDLTIEFHIGGMPETPQCDLSIWCGLK